MGSNYKEFEQELFLKLSLFPIPFCLIPLPGFISKLPGAFSQGCPAVSSTLG